MRTIEEEARIFYTRFYKRLQTHLNPLIKDLSILILPRNPNRRLKRKWCRDLLQNFNVKRIYEAKKKKLINTQE